VTIKKTKPRTYEEIRHTDRAFKSELSLQKVKQMRGNFDLRRGKRRPNKGNAKNPNSVVKKPHRKGKKYTDQKKHGVRVSWGDECYQWQTFEKRGDYGHRKIIEKKAHPWGKSKGAKKTNRGRTRGKKKGNLALGGCCSLGPERRGKKPSSCPLPYLQNDEEEKGGGGHGTVQDCLENWPKLALITSSKGGRG